MCVVCVVCVVLWGVVLWGVVVVVVVQAPFMTHVSVDMRQRDAPNSGGRTPGSKLPASPGGGGGGGGGGGADNVLMTYLCR